MAYPNLLSITLVRAQTAVQNITTTSTIFITNAAASGNVIKAGSVVVSNNDAANTAEISAEFVRNGFSYNIVNSVIVPPRSTLIVLGKESPLYLEEGDDIKLIASANNHLEAIGSYEVLG